jgi:hypothetical protein
MPLPRTGSNGSPPRPDSSVAKSEEHLLEMPGRCFFVCEGLLTAEGAELNRKLQALVLTQHIFSSFSLRALRLCETYIAILI